MHWGWGGTTGRRTGRERQAPRWRAGKGWPSRSGETKEGPGYGVACGLGPGLFAFIVKRIDHSKVRRDPNEETMLTPAILWASQAGRRNVRGLIIPHLLGPRGIKQGDAW